MSLNIEQIHKFRQEINEELDKYIEYYKSNQKNNCTKLINSTVTYYERMKFHYSTLKCTSDDEDEAGFISDEDEYTNIMQGRIYSSTDNLLDSNLLNYQTEETKKELLNLNLDRRDLGYRDYDDITEAADMSRFNIDTDSLHQYYRSDRLDRLDTESDVWSVKSDNLDEQTSDNLDELSSDDSIEGDFIENNKRTTVKEFTSEIEIDDDNNEDYEEPKIV